jgi:hypothetical protein
MSHGGGIGLNEAADRNGFQDVQTPTLIHFEEDTALSSLQLTVCKKVCFQRL